MPSTFHSRSRLSIRIAMVAAVAAVGTAAVGCFEQAGPITDGNGSRRSDSPPPPPTAGGPAVATVNGLTISRADLDGVLYEAFGLRMLFELAELDSARQLLLNEHLTLTADDIERERVKVLTKLLGPDRNSWDTLFEQFLQQKNITRTEFDIKVIQTRACLRKWIEPQLKGRITEPMIRLAFDQTYGALRRIQDIELPDLNSVAVARARLSRNEPFEQVAKSMSIDPLTRDSGGNYEPFSANNESIPQVIRQAAFGLSDGKISENLQVGEKFHIIRVTEAIPPKLYKYEEYRDSVRDTLEQQLLDEAVRVKQDELRNAALKMVRIEDPILKEQWAALQSGDRMTALSRPAVSKRIGDGQLTTMPTTEPTPTIRTGFPTTGPTTVPITVPTTGPATAPVVPLIGPTTHP